MRRALQLFPLLVFVLVVQTPAYASTGAANAPLVIFGIVVDTAFILSMVTSTVIPVLSALLAKTHWPPEAQGLITMVLATANGFLTEWAQSSDVNHYDWKHALIIALGSLLLAWAGHQVAWENSNTSKAALNFGSPTKIP